MTDRPGRADLPLSATDIADGFVRIDCAFAAEAAEEARAILRRVIGWTSLPASAGSDA